MRSRRRRVLTVCAGVVAPVAAMPAWALDLISPDDCTGEMLGPEETMDGDYGRILARAYESLNCGKGVTSPAGFEPALPA